MVTSWQLANTQALSDIADLHTITPEQFGAVADDLTTDYSAELQAALDAWVETGGNLVGSGQYRTDVTLYVTDSADGDLRLQLWMPYASRLGCIDFAHPSLTMRFSGRIQLDVAKDTSGGNVRWTAAGEAYEYAARYDSEDTLGGGEHLDTDTDTIREKLRDETEIGVRCQDFVDVTDFHIRSSNFCVGVLCVSRVANFLWSDIDVDYIQGSKFGVVCATDQRVFTSAAMNECTINMNRHRPDGTDATTDSLYAVVVESFGDIGDAAMDYRCNGLTINCRDVEWFSRTAADDTPAILGKVIASVINMGRFETITPSRIFRALRYDSSVEGPSINNVITLNVIKNKMQNQWDFPNEGNDWPNRFELLPPNIPNYTLRGSWRMADQFQPSGSDRIAASKDWSFAYYANLTPSFDRVYGAADSLLIDHITNEFRATSNVWTPAIGIELLRPTFAPDATRLVEVIKHSSTDDLGRNLFTLFDEDGDLLDSTNDAPPVYWMQFTEESNPLAAAENGTHNRWWDGGTGNNDRHRAMYSFHPDVRKIWFAISNCRLSEIELIVHAPAARFFSIYSDPAPPAQMPLLQAVPERGRYREGWQARDIGTGTVTCTTAGWAVKGDWAASTQYVTYDHVQASGNLYEAQDSADTGTHDGADNASVLTDTSKSWGVNALVGLDVNNTTDGSAGSITANTATTITATLSGGTDDDWDIGDAYYISGTTTPTGTTIGGTESDDTITWKCIAVGITKAVIA